MHDAPTWRERAAWVVPALLLLLLAWWLHGRASWASNVLIPAAAWMLLRGMT